MSQATADVISGDARSHFDVPDGDQAARVEDTGWYIAGQKLPLFPCLLFDLLHDEVEDTLALLIPIKAGFLLRG